MTLTFTQSSDQSFGGVPAYEAEFEVTGNFAIHIERTRGDAALILKQRTGGGKYALVDDFNYAKSKGEVLDYEASVTIPKFIKIVSEVEPTLAEIVTDGEVTEIKAQAKEIEVTTNGTTEVIPDSGFAYLSKVNIKTNVPQNGGGSGEGEGGGSTGGGSIEYIDVRSMDEGEKILLSTLAFAFNGAIKIGTNIVNVIYPFGSFGTTGITLSLPELKFIAIDFGFKMTSPDGTQSIKDSLIEQYNYTEEDIAALPRITEEEFYNLNA